MYMISALWTHARQHLNITTIILKTRHRSIVLRDFEMLSRRFSLLCVVLSAWGPGALG
jgi:hypothetical protein